MGHGVWKSQKQSHSTSRAIEWTKIAKNRPKISGKCQNLNATFLVIFKHCDLAFYFLAAAFAFTFLKNPIFRHETKNDFHFHSKILLWHDMIFFLSFQAYNAIHLDLERYLRSHGINQVTIQPEFPGELTDDQLMMMNFKDCCLLNCHSDWCEPQKCCDETKVNTTVIIWKWIDFQHIPHE